MTTSTIHTILANKGFTVQSLNSNAPKDPTLDTLSLLLSFQFPTFRHLLRSIRGDIRSEPAFQATLRGLNQNERGSLKNICMLLCRNDLLQRYSVNETLNAITGEVKPTDRAFKFFTGQWLERCIGVNIQSFLNLEGCRVEIAHNIQVLRPKQSDGVKRVFEMDTLLAVDDELYWWEAKSGRYTREHLDRYSQVARELNLRRRQCLLVVGEPWPQVNLRELGLKIGFQVVEPQCIARKVEEIETECRQKTRDSKGLQTPSASMVS